MLDLDPIKARLGEWKQLHTYCQECAMDDDVCDLIAEVELLRRQLDEMMAFLMSVPDSVLCECGRVCELDVENV